VNFASGDVPEVAAAQVIFWILLPLVLFARPRWAVLVWLVMGNLDATGPGQTSTAVGWINATKGVVIPLYLWWRLRRVPDEVSTTPSARLWLMLTGYAALAIFWSPFQIPGIKLVGNMVGLLLSIIVAEKAVRRGLLRIDTLTVLILASLFLGILQTYYFRGTSYGFDGVDRPLRFSSFIAAQQYGALLVAFLAVVLWHGSLRRVVKVSLSLLLCAALLLNGSRTWFIGAGIVVAVYAWLCSRRITGIIAFVASTVALSTLLVLNLTRFDTDILGDTSSRILATVSAVFTGQDTPNDAGLGNLNFRLAIYKGVLADTRLSSPREILLGHGTSSGGNVALHVFPTRYRLDQIDSNRTIHNEWLRAFYEWGVIGLTLWVAVFASILVGLVMRYRIASSRMRASAGLSFLPAFLAALATENIVAGAGNAGTMSFAIVMAILWAPTVPQLLGTHRV
jgi:hypothetical protein